MMTVQHERDRYQDVRASGSRRRRTPAGSSCSIGRAGAGLSGTATNGDLARQEGLTEALADGAWGSPARGSLADVRIVSDAEVEGASPGAEEPARRARQEDHVFEVLRISGGSRTSMNGMEALGTRILRPEKRSAVCSFHWRRR